jgi:hypothetical protein
MESTRTQRLIKSKHVLLIPLLALMVLALCACSLKVVSPSVTITSSPTDIAAGDITISVDISKFVLSEETSKNVSGEGHIVFYMDVSVPTYYEHSAKSAAGTYVIAHKTYYTWKNVSPGEHTFSVQLVNNKDMPLPSPVVDSITISVAAPQGTPDIQIISPADNSSLTPGNVEVRVELENFIISKSDMGAINRKGEGHLIYYLDEAVPTTQGLPSVTDTSSVSTDINHVWKHIGAGTHTLSVQLVNNDDTPLDEPVVKVITLEVKP